MKGLRICIVTALIVAPVIAQSGPAYQERDFLTRIRRLTVEGKRAGEGYWSPDGKRLVFQSEREPDNPFYQIYVLDFASGETKRISPGIGKTTCPFFRPARDEIECASTHADLKSKELQQAELAIMRADGSGQRRLSSVKGYDGGPCFTPDGRRIVWRRFDESGLIADVRMMNVDGTDQRQITDFGSMSWAPYMHPSGDYIIFASNKLGIENFELFMVDAHGTKEPVRVTYSDGFDGLPVPSPDGKQLAWTSTRSSGSAGQLYLAQWNHDKALEAIRNAPPKKPAKKS